MTVDCSLHPHCVLRTVISLSQLASINGLKDKIDVLKAGFNHIDVNYAMLEHFYVGEEHGRQLVNLKFAFYTTATELIYLCVLRFRDPVLLVKELELRVRESYWVKGLCSQG